MTPAPGSWTVPHGFIREKATGSVIALLLMCSPHTRSSRPLPSPGRGADRSSPWPILGPGKEACESQVPTPGGGGDRGEGGCGHWEQPQAGTEPLLSWEGQLTRPDSRGDLRRCQPHGVPAAAGPGPVLCTSAGIGQAQPGGAGSWAEGLRTRTPWKV